MRSELALGALLLATSSGATAEARLYAGLGLGVAEMSFERGLEGSDTALQAFAGYAFTQYVAAEISYLDAGTADSRFGAAVETSAFTASVLASLPLGKRWSLFARAGAFNWRWKSARIEHEGTDLTYGIGGAASLGRIQIRLEGGGAHLDDDEIRLALLQGFWRF